MWFGAKQSFNGWATLQDFSNMITIQAKKHDNFSVEFKCGYEDMSGRKKVDFAVNTWIFVPNSLDVNPENYGKKQFYRDIKSNVRLITPVYLLRDIAEEDSLPYVQLRNALEALVRYPSQEQIDDYEYHLKMYAAIFRSAQRNQSHHIRRGRSIKNDGYLIRDYVADSERILAQFRSLYHIIDVPTIKSDVRKYFHLVDEFMSQILTVQCLRTMRYLDSVENNPVVPELKSLLTKLIEYEREYKTNMSYFTVSSDVKNNTLMVFHHGMLKKYVESDLYVKLDKKRDGVAVEQIYYSIAAGVAMIFATSVAWITQLRYGNITLPLFVALVVSYMLKDRIKDLMRYYFAHRLGNKYYDKKALVSIGKKKIGLIKEGVDFISPAKVPSRVMSLRDSLATIQDATNIFDEKIILFRKHVTLNDAVLMDNDEYPMRGINEIVRLHLHRFAQKMDNPEIPVDTLDDAGNVKSVKVPKIYYLHVVFQLKHDDQEEYKHFRITMTRNGIVKLEENK